MSVLLALLAVVGGLALLTVGADRLIDAAVAIARRLRLPEAVIGATIVAGGTSMPELVASVGGALGGQYGLAVGNVVGSNSFNVGVILGLVALIAPLQVAPAIARFDWPIMAALSIACCAIALGFGVFPLWACAAFLAGWLGYTVWSVRSGHGTEGAAVVDARLLAPAPAGLGIQPAGHRSVRGRHAAGRISRLSRTPDPCRDGVGNLIHGRVAANAILR
jgi:Ca2+/Na+ antiporter